MAVDKSKLRQDAYKQMTQTVPVGEALPVGVTPNQAQTLSKKGFDVSAGEGSQSSMGRPDLAIESTANQLNENRKAKAQENQGIDFGGIAKDVGGAALGGLGGIANFASKIPTSALIGMKAGGEAGKDVYLASALGGKSGELAGRELQESQLEEQRKLTAAQQAAENEFKKSQLDLSKQQIEATREAKQTEEQRRQQEMLEKNVDAIADTLNPADAAKLRGLSPELKAQVLKNPNLVKQPGFFQSLGSKITGTKAAKINPKEFEASTANANSDPLGLGL